MTLQNDVGPTSLSPSKEESISKEMSNALPNEIGESLSRVSPRRRAVSPPLSLANFNSVKVPTDRLLSLYRKCTFASVSNLCLIGALMYVYLCSHCL